MRLHNQRGQKIETIQVCYSLRESKERELKGILSAMDKFKLKEGIIITEDYESEEKIENKRIKYIPLWKWLLE